MFTIKGKSLLNQCSLDACLHTHTHTLNRQPGFTFNFTVRKGLVDVRRCEEGRGRKKENERERESE